MSKYTNFIVTTDSGCDLPISFCDSISVIPLKMHYTIDGTVFTDNMLHEECKFFYDKMRNGAAPVTSQINPSEYIDFWKPLLEYGLPIVHISLGSGISGSYNNAVNAVSIIKEDHPDAEILVVDSTQASMGYAMFVVKAAEMRDAGNSAQECVDWLNANKIKAHAFFTTGDLKYLYRGGRVKRSSAVLGTLLNINPILNLDKEGHLQVFDKARGQKATLKRMIKLISERVVDPSSQTLYVAHSDSEKAAHEFGEAMKNELHFKDVFYSYIGSIIGAHTGPGLVTVFFYGIPRV